MGPVIWFGNKAKNLKSALQLGSNATISSGATDPSSIALAGNAGDVYLSTSTFSVYTKQTNGTDTNWTKTATLISFTQGSVPFADALGNLAQDNTKFFWDATNKRLGIGVAAPTQALDVSGNGAFTGTLSGSNLSGSNTGDVTLAAFGSAPSNNAASLSGQVLTLQPADATHPGAVSTTTQTFAGNKTFSGTISASNLSGTNTGDQTITLTADVTGSGTGSFATNVAKIQGTTVSGTTGNTNVVFSNSPTLVSPTLGTPTSVTLTNGTGLPLTTGVTGTLPTGNGGTGVTSLGNFTDAGTDGITVTGGTGAVIINMSIAQHVADGTHNGYLSSGDWTSFTNTAAAAVTSLTGDVTATGPGASAATVAKIQGTTVSGTTGSTNVVFSASPTLTGTLTAAAVNLSGVLDLGSHKITSVTDPTSNQDAATKAYVDNVAAGINPAVAVLAATTAASDTSSFSYLNGVNGIGATLTGPVNTAFTVDGITFTVLGQRVLVKNDTQAPSGAYNGTYYVTQLQTALLPVILTRTLDFDQPSDINNTGAIPVLSGTVNTTTQWVVSSSVTTVGTDAITFTKFARNPADYILKGNDITETSFAAANNQAAAANVTGFAFANGTVRAFEALVSVYVNATSSLYESFKLYGIQRDSDWALSQTSNGDNSNFVFTITTAGQIKYTSGNYAGFSAATVKFRAETLSI